MLLESLNEARRGGAFLCQLSEVDQRRPPGVLTNVPTNVPGLWQFLQLGWPSFSLSDNNLAYTQNGKIKKQSVSFTVWHPRHHPHFLLFCTRGTFNTDLEKKLVENSMFAIRFLCFFLMFSMRFF